MSHDTHIHKSISKIFYLGKERQNIIRKMFAEPLLLLLCQQTRIMSQRNKRTNPVITTFTFLAHRVRNQRTGHTSIF